MKKWLNFSTVELRFFFYGSPQDIEVTYEIYPVMASTSSGKATLEEGKTYIKMGTMEKPGFLDLRLKAKIKDKTYEHHIKVGFSPELLTPYTNNPEDFDEIQLIIYMLI